MGCLCARWPAFGGGDARGVAPSKSSPEGGDARPPAAAPPEDTLDALGCCYPAAAAGGGGGQGSSGTPHQQLVPVANRTVARSEKLGAPEDSMRLDASFNLPSINSASRKLAAMAARSIADWNANGVAAVGALVPWAGVWPREARLRSASASRCPGSGRAGDAIASS